MGYSGYGRTLPPRVPWRPIPGPEQLVSAHLDGSTSTREATKGNHKFMELARHPMVLDAVQQLIGPDFLLWGCQVFCKPGGTGMEVPMHQDGNYWPIRPLTTCTVWVALDRSDVGNGCLRVIPRSHISREQYTHEKTDSADVVLNQYVPEEALALMAPAVDLELEPGQMSLHDVNLIHGSNPNASPRRRAGVAYRYMPTTSHFDRQLFSSDAASGYVVDWEHRPIFMMRGMDRCGKNTCQPVPQPSKM